MDGFTWLIMYAIENVSVVGKNNSPVNKKPHIQVQFKLKFQIFIIMACRMYTTFISGINILLGLWCYPVYYSDHEKA